MMMMMMITLVLIQLYNHVYLIHTIILTSLNMLFISTFNVDHYGLCLELFGEAIHDLFKFYDSIGSEQSRPAICPKEVSIGT